MANLKKQQYYQPLAHTDDVTEVFDGRSESLLHVTAEENRGGRGEVSQSRDL